MVVRVSINKQQQILKISVLIWLTKWFILRLKSSTKIYFKGNKIWNKLKLKKVNGGVKLNVSFEILF